MLMRVLKNSFRTVFPLGIRKKIAIITDQQTWLKNPHSLSMGMIRDWAEKDADAYHRFLWAHHLGYAKYYEGVNTFGTQHLVITRKMLFEDLKKFLSVQGTSPLQEGKVGSIFDVGCSAGYLLRAMETDIFPSATILEGADIDGPAIEMGKTYLRANGSKIQLVRADMADLDHVMDKKKFDLILCAGVLTYLHEQAAADVVRSMLNHCSGLVAIKERAYHVVDNRELKGSKPRESDGSFIHNIDAMVDKGGGTVIYRRWEGVKDFDGQTVYFVFCRPK